MKRIWWLVAVLLLGLASCSSGRDRISGVVLDEGGAPLAGAVVRVRATDKFTATDSDGKFTLADLRPGESHLMTAWAPGYYIGGGESEFAVGTTNVEIVLKKHTDEDNPDYEWVSAFLQPGIKGSNCEECHSALTLDRLSPPEGAPTGRVDSDSSLPSGEGVGLRESLPFDEWVQDAHALSAQNPRFLSMYLGQDLDDNQSPSTRYGYSRDYGSFPLRPDLTQPYFGPGYKLDFPETAGNCAACHAPVAAVDAAYAADPTQVTGVGAESATCDFCHKIWDARLDPASGLPYANMPGVLSFEFRRPPEGHQFFAGPLDDVAPGEDTYSPLQQQSQFCAPCHFGVFWDTVIYNSFGEWLESPYSDPETGQTCQDCHMPPIGVAHFALPEAGGQERNPQTIFSHRMPGAADEELIQNALSMNVDARREEDTITVEVELINDKTGHHVPTDSPLRHLILLVQVTDENGEKLEQVEGPTVPEWGGVGNYEDGHYAGAPGTAYAKILQDMWTEVAPTGAYWNPTRIISDNRIPALGSDITVYTFLLSEPSKTSELSVTVKLLYRRAFSELMTQKNWAVADIVMAQDRICLP